jgi:ubiquinone/menaquinone biosynthesis C-methylase UbiE
MKTADLPYVFIGSSSEGKRIAQAIQASLSTVCNSIVWNQGFFEPGKGYLENLTNELLKFDFAILVFTPDDRIDSRNVQSEAPRDNVLIELGLFIGSIGRSRTFAVCQEDVDVKIPSDLAGVTLIPFRKSGKGPLLAAVGPACYTISSVVQSLGVRQAAAAALPPTPPAAAPQDLEAEAQKRAQAEKGIVGANAAPPSVDLWYDQLRPVLHESTQYTTPTYWLDADLNVLDWNLAFDLVFAELTPILRYRHVNEFIARLANYDAVFNHARAFSKRIYAGEVLWCDTETLVYRSRSYGDVTMLKVAAQLHDPEGNLKGWVVSLLIRQIDWDSFQRDLQCRINDEKLWNGYAPAYDRILLGFPPYERLLKDVSAIIPDSAVCVLDIGAGTGNSTKALLDRGFFVTSLEPNASMINKMRARRFDPVHHKVMKASAEDLNTLRGLEDQSFDGVTLVNVLYCLDDPFACLTGIHRVLKSGGFVGLSTTHARVSLDPLLAAIKSHLISSGTYESLKEDYERLYDSNKQIERTIARRVTAEKYREMVEDAGFEIIKIEEFTYVDAVMLIHARKN